jgi:Tfp pilus assembly protein PilO
MTTKEVLILEQKETKLKRTLKSGTIHQSDLRRIRAKLRDVQNRLDRARLGV